MAAECYPHKRYHELLLSPDSPADSIYESTHCVAIWLQLFPCKLTFLIHLRMFD